AFASGRGGGGQDGAVSLTGLLPAVRCGAQLRDHPGRHHRRDGADSDIRALRPPHRQRRSGFDGAQEARRVFLMSGPASHSVAGTGPRGEPRDLLRFLTCGSVDDGKSTLIGRLLCDTKLIMEDQLATLERESRRHGTTGDAIDLALLVDGLEAEREQGITIDVAYRYFSTPRRSFIAADTPGHE